MMLMLAVPVKNVPDHAPNDVPLKLGPKMEVIDVVGADAPMETVVALAKEWTPRLSKIIANR